MQINFTSTDLNQVNELLKDGSKSFYAASFLLPKHVRNPAKALYSFCRVADDKIDDAADPFSSLDELNLRLDNIYSKHQLDNIEDRAMAAVVHDFDIPRDILDALLEGFTWDASGRKYKNLSELIDYSARVAGTVGVMMSIIMGKREPEVLARASDLGVAMQLTNIARDIGEDARAGRLYLPLEWFAELGLNYNNWLKEPVFNAAIMEMVQRLLDKAEELYSRADCGIFALPKDCHNGIRAARLLYAEIGHELQRKGMNSVDHRSVVSTQKKLKLLYNMFVSTYLQFSFITPKHEAPLKECLFLINCVDKNYLESDELNPLFKKNVNSIEKNAVWVIDLFEKLEHRQQEYSMSLSDN